VLIHDVPMKRNERKDPAKASTNFCLYGSTTWGPIVVAAGRYAEQEFVALTVGTRSDWWRGAESVMDGRIGIYGALSARVCV